MVDKDDDKKQSTGSDKTVTEPEQSLPDAQLRSENNNQEPEHHYHTQLSDEIKFRDYLMSQLSDMIEERMERRIRKTVTFFQVTGLAIVIVLGPSAWFAVNNLIKNAIIDQSKVFDEKIAENRELVAKMQSSIQQQIEKETLYLSAANYATFLNQNTVLSKEQLERIVATLKDLAQHDEIIKRPGFSLVLNNISDSLIKFGYGGYLKEIQNKYAKTISQSPELSSLFLNYYARRVVSTTNTENLRDSDLFQSYLRVRRYTVENNQEYLSMPMDMLISFHLASEVRNKTSTRTLNNTRALSIEEKAHFLWDLLRNTNPKFWRRNPAPSDYLVSQVAKRLFLAYKEEIIVLALSNGVKETILRRYENARNPEDKALGRFILETIYNISI